MDKAVLIVKQVEQEGPGMLGTFFEDAGWRLVTVELGRRESLPDQAWIASRPSSCSAAP